MPDCLAPQSKGLAVFSSRCLRQTALGMHVDLLVLLSLWWRWAGSCFLLTAWDRLQSFLHFTNGWWYFRNLKRKIPLIFYQDFCIPKPIAWWISGSLKVYKKMNSLIKVRKSVSFRFPHWDKFNHGNVIMCFPCKHEEQNLIFRTHVTNLGEKIYIYNTSTITAETISPGLTGKIV